MRALLLPCVLGLLPALAVAQFPGFPGGPGFPGLPGFPGFPGFPAPTPNYSITTSTDFAVAASLGTGSGFDSVATGTAVTRGLAVNARTGASRTDAAVAQTFATFARGREGQGVSILEVGGVRNSDPNVGGSAGTSGDAPGTTSPTLGAHGLTVAYPTIASGTNVIVSIHWRARASTGASASASVDIDGDGTADFTGSAGAPVTQLLQTTAGANGVAIGIATNASAALAADGSENYLAQLEVFVMPGTLPTSCTFTNFGAACGADLNGTVGTGLSLSLDVTNAPANAFTFFVAGDQATTPTPLPQGTCNLLVDGRRFFHGFMARTDATGAVSMVVPTPRTALTVSFQAIVVTFDATTQTRSMVASNGTELVCQ